jgi:hypothetical protein
MSGQKGHSAHARWEVSCLGGLRSTRSTVSPLVVPYDRCTEVERYAPCSAMRGSVESQCKDDSRRIPERILEGHLLAQTHGGTTAGLRKGVWNEQFSVGYSTHAWSYARTQRELLLCNGLMCMVSWSCGHACGFVVARRFFPAPRNAVWSCVAMTLRSKGA